MIIRRLDESTGDVILNELVSMEGDGTFVVESVESAVHGLLYKRTTARGDRLLAAAWQLIDVGVEPQTNLELRGALWLAMRLW